MLRTLARTVVTAALLGAVCAWGEAKQQKPPRVGFCEGFGDREHAFHKSFVEGMRKRGWEDGRNVRIVIPEAALSKGFGPLQSCAEYMADKNIDVLVNEGHSEPTPKIPVVTALANVAGTPLATSSTRNITGLTQEDPRLLHTKRMALLKEATGAENIFFLDAMPPGPKYKPGVGRAEDVSPEVREAAAKLGVAVARVNFTVFEDFEPAFNAIAKKPRSALIFLTGMHWYKIRSNDVGVEDFIAKHRLPVLFPQPDWVRANDKIMIAYGPSYLEQMERYSYFVDRILRGAKPSELPFESLPPRLGLNLDAAKTLGITFPRSVLLQADVVVPYDPRFEWTTRTDRKKNKEATPKPAAR